MYIPRVWLIQKVYVWPLTVIPYLRNFVPISEVGRGNAQLCILKQRACLMYIIHFFILPYFSSLYHLISSPDGVA